MTEQLATWFSSLFSEGIGKELVAFLASLLPIIECRGGMIIAKAASIPFFKAFFLCYLGNMIPIPFILLFIKQIFKFMKQHHILTGFIEKLEGKTAKNQDKVLRYKQWGLLLFIAIPLPGTGAWTGTLAASILNMGLKKSALACMGGVILAGIIMGILSTLGVAAFA